jgi:hypothetical protein
MLNRVRRPRPCALEREHDLFRDGRPTAAVVDREAQPQPTTGRQLLLPPGPDVVALFAGGRPPTAEGRESADEMLIKPGPNIIAERPFSCEEIQRKVRHELAAGGRQR